MPANNILDGPVTTLLSIQSILVLSPFMCSCEEGESLNDFKSGTSNGRFSTDDVASMAVKWLKQNNKKI